MSGRLENEVSDWLTRSRDVIEAAITDDDFRSAVADSAVIIREAIRNGGQVLLAGNGGSAAQAQHFAGELVGRFQQRERAALPALALTADPVALTAIANDYGYEWVFERQLCAHARESTVLVAISTSGSSLNVLRAVDTARQMNIEVIGMTGQPGEPLRWRCDRAIVAPSTETPLIQQIHMVAAHWICSILDEATS